MTPICVISDLVVIKPPNVKITSEGIGGKIFSNKKFLIFTFLSFLTWMIFTQFSLLVPLRAEAILRQPKKVALVWTIMSIFVIFIQSLINKIILNRFSPVISLCAGMFIISAAIFLIGFSLNFYYLIVIALIFALGEMLYLPTTDSLTSRLSTPELLGAYFSIANIAAGLGSALGSYLGGVMVEKFGITGNITPWLIFLVFGLSSTILTLIMGRSISPRVE